MKIAKCTVLQYKLTWQRLDLGRKVLLLERAESGIALLE
jgi:hypothetical protein